jgi:tetratricopeptide (TPR) repeat protein
VAGGFFVFGNDSRDEKKAQALADELLAAEWMSAGAHERALAGLTRYLEREPEDAAKLLQLGQAHLKLKHWEAARDAFKRSLAGKGGSTKLTAIDPWAHTFLGRAQDALGKREEAVKEYQTVVDSGATYGGVQALAKRFLDKPFNPAD